LTGNDHADRCSREDQTDEAGSGGGVGLGED
jgi:hypothetical protein